MSDQQHKPQQPENALRLVPYFEGGVQAHAQPATSNETSNEKDESKKGMSEEADNATIWQAEQEPGQGHVTVNAAMANGQPRTWLRAANPRKTPHKTGQSKRLAEARTIVAWGRLCEFSPKYPPRRRPPPGTA